MTNERDYSFAALRNRLTITGLLVAETALRVGAGRDIEVMGNDLPVLRDARGNPIIPGASLKGSFRARLEALIRAVEPKAARDLNEIESHMRTCVAELRTKDEAIVKLRSAGDTVGAAQLFSQKVIAKSTLIDLTFGAPWIAGRVFFRDALVDESLWFDKSQFEVRNGVAIDRDTETVSDNKLYDYEVVPAGTRFHFSLTAENLEDWQLGMLLLGLKPWKRGEVQIGGFRSRGLGHVKLVGPGGATEPTVHFVSVSGVDGVLKLLDEDQTSTNVADEDQKGWIEAFKKELSLLPGKYKGQKHA